MVKPAQTCLLHPHEPPTLPARFSLPFIPTREKTCTRRSQTPPELHAVLGLLLLWEDEDRCTCERGLT